MRNAGAANSARANRGKSAGYRARPMRVDDADRAAEIHVQVWREAYRLLMPQDFLDSLNVLEFAAQWRNWLADPATGKARPLVGLDPDGNIVGLGSAGPSRDQDTPTEWELYAINVLATEHGTGLADLMMTELIADRACSLWVLQSNARAIAFYTRYGFATDGHTRTHSPTGEVETRLVRGRML